MATTWWDDDGYNGKGHIPGGLGGYDYPMMDDRALRRAAERRRDLAWEQQQREKLRRAEVRWEWTNRFFLAVMLALVFVLARACGDADLHAAGCSQKGQSCSATKPCCEGLTCRGGGCRDDGAVPTTTQQTGPTTTSSTTSTTLIIGGPVEPIRFANGHDISSAITRRKDRCKFIDGRTATQPQRAAMYLAGVARLMADGLVYAKYHPTCRDAVGKSESDFETENLRLRVYYVDVNRNSVWSIAGDNGCPDYEHVHDLGVRLNSCSTQSLSAKRDCATVLNDMGDRVPNPYLTPELQAFANLRVVNGLCEKGPMRGPSTLVEDSRRAAIGTLDYRKAIPVLVTQQRVKRDILVEAHHQSDGVKCGKPAGPLAGQVKARSLAFANSASTPEQQHAFFLDFTSTVDRGPSGWSDQQVCDWAQLEGLAMHAWGACFDLPPKEQWPCATRRRVTHETLHVCAAYRNDELAVRLGDHSETQLTAQPARSCAAWLSCLTDGSCSLPWVTSGWRILMNTQVAAQ